MPHSAMARTASSVCWRMDGVAVTLLILLACAPRQDGLTRLPLNEDIPLAFGDQRLLLPLDRRQSYQVHLTPAAGDVAFVTASLCALDSHQRIDDGDSHCLGQEVSVDANGASSLTISPAMEANEHKLGHLALRVFAEGTSPGPVTLRIDATP
jgi:hypothetical protein